MLIIAFVVTLGVGVTEGIAASVAMSLIAVIYRSTKPHYAVLGKLPETSEFRNRERFSNVETTNDVLVIRYDAELFFANINHFIETIKKEIDQKGDGLKLIIIHAGSMAHIDSTAFQALVELIQDLKTRGILLYLTDIIGPTRDFFEKAEFDKQVGPNCRFNDIQGAINYYELNEKRQKES